MENDCASRDDIDKSEHPVEPTAKEGQEFKGVTVCPENERRVADYPEEHTDHGVRGSGSFIVIHIGKNMKAGEEYKR